MKSLIAVILISASFASDAIADRLDYDLEVSGMVCAFCAYNVSQQLESIDGVTSGSVAVDLEQGRVKLQAEQELKQAQIADLLLQAGFKLDAVTRTEASNSPLRERLNHDVLLSITMNSGRIRDGEFDQVLEALGAFAVEQLGRITVVGSGELETAILKPVLGGRRTVIKVDYDRTARPEARWVARPWTAGWAPPLSSPWWGWSLE